MALSCSTRSTVGGTATLGHSWPTHKNSTRIRRIFTDLIRENREIGAIRVESLELLWIFLPRFTYQLAVLYNQAYGAYRRNISSGVSFY